MNRNILSGKFTMPIAISVLIPLTVFFTLVRASSYPIISYEVILSTLIIIILGLLAGSVLRFMPQILRIFIYAVLITLSANALFRPFPESPILQSMGSEGVLILVFLASLVLLFLVRTHNEKFIVTVYLAMLVSSFLIVPGSDYWELHTDKKDITSVQDSTLRPYIHIVLDGHMGFEPMVMAGLINQSEKDVKVSAYTRLGFHVNGNAYVDHIHTMSSFSDFLYFGSASPGAVLSKPRQTLVGNVLKNNNSLFELLASKGYELNVIQSSYLDLCASTSDQLLVQNCTQYPFTPLMKGLKHSDLAVSSLVTIMVNQIFVRSGVVGLFNMVARSDIGLEIGFPEWPVKVCISCIASTTAINVTRSQIINIDNGQAFFIHLITPHAPFQNYKNDCSADYSLEFKIASTDNILDRYINQSKCADRLVTELIEKVINKPAGKNAVIVVQGDHGPRPEDMNVRKETYSSDMSKVEQIPYSALFAVRSYATEPGYTNTLLPLNELLEEVASDL